MVRNLGPLFRARRGRSFTRAVQLATVVGGVQLGLGRSARAEDGEGVRSSLAWARQPGAEACLAPPALATAVEARLGRKVFVAPSDAEVTIEGSAAPRAGGGFRAELRIVGRDGSVQGTRSIEDDDPACAGLAARVPFVVSVMLEPGAEGAAAEPAPAAEPPPPPPPRTVVRTVAPPPSPWAFGAELVGVAVLGLQPALGAGFDVGLIVRPPEVGPLVLSGGLTGATEARAGASRAVVGLAWGALRACPLALPPAGLDLRGCVGVQVGTARARGHGFAGLDLGDDAPFVAALAGLRASPRLAGPFRLVASLEASALLVRHEIGFVDEGVAKTSFRASPVGGVGRLGLAVEVP